MPKKQPRQDQKVRRSAENVLEYRYGPNATQSVSVTVYSTPTEPKPSVLVNGALVY